MKLKSLTLLTALLLSLLGPLGCTKNEPEANYEVQRGPASIEEPVQPINKKGNIYLEPANDPAERCKDLYGTITC